MTSGSKIPVIVILAVSLVTSVEATRVAPSNGCVPICLNQGIYADINCVQKIDLNDNKEILYGNVVNEMEKIINDHEFLKNYKKNATIELLKFNSWKSISYKWIDIILH